MTPMYEGACTYQKLGYTFASHIPGFLLHFLNFIFVSIFIHDEK